jgi:pimeloyl-ACP methyl ester carboxylesterase
MGPTAGVLETAGATIAYEVEGEGHPVLLIHGGLGTRRMWDGQVPSLAERYRVIRYDTRGFGETKTDDVAYLDADDAVAVLDHVGAASAHVIGQSRGGSIALDLALAHPERVDALVSVAGGIHGFEAERGTSVPQPWEEMDRLWQAKDWDALSELETQVWVDGWGQAHTRVAPEVRALVHGWILEANLADLPWGQPGSLEPSAAERLGEVRAPTLVLIGEADEPGGVVAGHHLAASVPGARSVEFPRVAHMIHLEEPARFDAEVRGFLAHVDRRAEDD